MPDYTPSDSFKQASMADKLAYLSEKIPGFASLDAKAKGDYVNHLLGNEQPPAAEPTFTDKVNDFASRHSVLGPVARFANSAAQTAAGIVPGIYHAAVDPLTPEETADFQGHSRIPGEVTLERLTGARDIVNAAKTYADPNTRPSLDQAASVLPEALGQGVGAVAGTKALGAAADTVKPGLGRLTRSPEDNSLRPAVKVAGKLGGAAIGHATGIPEAGVAGFLTGSQVLDSILPDNPEAMAREAADSRDAAYESRAKDLMRRGKEQDALDRRAATDARRAAKATPPTMPSTDTEPMSANAGQGETAPPVEGERGSNPIPKTMPDPNVVLHLPEAQAKPPGFINLMNSIPRDQILGAAERGRPGAIEQLRDLGQPSLIVPPAADFSGLKERVSFPSDPTLPPPTMPEVPSNGGAPPAASASTGANLPQPGSVAPSPFQLIRKPPVPPPQQ